MGTEAVQLSVRAATSTAIVIGIRRVAADERMHRHSSLPVTEPETQLATERLTETLTEIEMRLATMPTGGTDDYPVASATPDGDDPAAVPPAVRPAGSGEDMPDWLSSAWEVHQAQQELQADRRTLAQTFSEWRAWHRAHRALAAARIQAGWRRLATARAFRRSRRGARTVQRQWRGARARRLVQQQQQAGDELARWKREAAAARLALERCEAQRVRESAAAEASEAGSNPNPHPNRNPKSQPSLPRRRRRSCAPSSARCARRSPRRSARSTRCSHANPNHNPNPNPDP